LTISDVLVIASAAGFPTLAAILLGGLLNRRKNKVDTSAVIEGAALRIAGRLDIDVDRLQTKVDLLTEQLDAALDRARRAEDLYVKCQRTILDLTRDIQRAREALAAQSGGLTA
jgi:hypothetical protein